MPAQAPRVPEQKGASCSQILHSRMLWSTASILTLGFLTRPRSPSQSTAATVTLRGTVERFSQRRAAVEDANKIDGVDEVDDELKVNLIGADRREDDEIRGNWQPALIWDTDVPSELGRRKSQGWLDYPDRRRRLPVRERRGLRRCCKSLWHLRRHERDQGQQLVTPHRFAWAATAAHIGRRLWSH